MYASDFVWIAAFRCPPEDLRWRTENNSGERCIIAFPRTAVGIRQSGRPTVVTDATVVTLYNPQQPFTRHLVDPRGDICEFFAVDAATMVEALRPWDASAADRQESPFVDAYAHVGAEDYFAQRRLFERVCNEPDADNLEIDEACASMLGAVMARIHAHGRRHGVGSPARADTVAAHRDLVVHARSILAREFCSQVTLRDLASRTHTSPYHLCRVFRAHTGLSIHQHLTQLRLRESLARLTDPAADLTRLAIDLGFCSHSHFTRAFRRAFGLAPSEARGTFAHPVSQANERIARRLGRATRPKRVSYPA